MQGHYWKSLSAYACALLLSGIERRDRNLLLRGAGLLEDMARNDPLVDAATFQNLGVAYNYLTDFDPRYKPKMVEYTNEYFKRAPADDPARPMMERLLRARSPDYF